MATFGFTDLSAKVSGCEDGEPTVPAGCSHVCPPKSDMLVNCIGDSTAVNDAISATASVAELTALKQQLEAAVARTDGLKEALEWTLAKVVEKLPPTV